MRRSWLALALVFAACRGSEEVFDFAVGGDLSSQVDGAPAGDAGFAESFVTAAGGHLFLGSERFRFVGANRYDLASFPPGSGKFACGNGYGDLDLGRLLGELASTGATVVRLWAFQSFTLGGSDFSTLDRVIAAARGHGLKLILVLENQWADCTQPDPAGAGAKSPTWYQTGYYTGPLGTDALAYRDYARLLASRYAGEPAIAMWQLMNEAECTDPVALLGFASDMASVLKSVDGVHLVSLGTRGTGQAGTAGPAYRALHAIQGIDLVEAHDYGAEDQPLPAALAGDLQIAQAIGKPFFVGEAGIAAPAPQYRYTFSERAARFDAKLAAEWAAGADGFVIRSFYDLRSDNALGFDFSPSDPLAAVIAHYAALAP